MRIEKKEGKVFLEASESEFRFLMKTLRTARERYWERMHMLPSSAFEDVEILKKTEATKESLYTFLDAYIELREGKPIVTHTTDETFDLGREYI